MIKEVMKSLTPEQREKLMTAFDKEEAYMVEYSINHFIGCHLVDDPKCVILDKTEYWRIVEYAT